jgi:hypothetical protein
LIIFKNHLLDEGLHDQIGWFFEKYPYVGLYCGVDLKRRSRNSWLLSSSNFDSSLADIFMYGEKNEDAGDFLFNYICFGSSHSDGGIGLGICAAPVNFGKIACCTFSACSERGDVPIVANTFTEWLERTLDHGPDADCFYWQKDDFIDLGPAIPGDPNYRPIGKVP